MTSAARSEYSAAYDLFDSYSKSQNEQGYNSLYRAQGPLIQAIEAAYGDPKLQKVVKLLNGALVRDVSVITGTWVKK